MPILRRLIPLFGFSSLALPSGAFAWQPPAGSPPGWHSTWVQTVDRVDVFVHADGDRSFGEAQAGLYFRVDAPAQDGRLWVYDPLGDTWAWLAQAGTVAIAAPTPDDVAASAHALDPAAGLAQFVPSTWAATPEGKQGLSPFEPLANIDAAIWLARTRGWTQWQVYSEGACR